MAAIDARAASATAAGSLSRMSCHLATRPAGRAVAVGGIVRAGLVGERIGPDAALDHFRQDLGGIAEQADAGRLGRALRMISSASSMLVARRSR